MSYLVRMASWLDQQMVSGVPNSYLLIGAGVVILIAAVGARKSREGKT